MKVSGLCRSWGRNRFFSKKFEADRSGRAELDGSDLRPERNQENYEMPLKPTRCFVKLPAVLRLPLNSKDACSTGRPLPERLIASTVTAALRISRDETALAHALPHQAAWLARHALAALASNRWRLVLAIAMASALVR
jgi:hypothetical protein